MVYHVSEYSKLAQKEYKTREDKLGKMIQWELCNRFRFGHADKLYMYKPFSGFCQSSRPLSKNKRKKKDR